MWEELLFASCVEMILVEDALQKMRSKVSFNIALLLLMLGTLILTRLSPKFFKQAFVGLLSSKIQGSL